MNRSNPLEVLLEKPLTRDTIAGLKTRALRRRVWYRVLSRMERGLLDLTMRWVDKVRSGLMARVLLRILVKLARALNERMVRVLGRGRELALGLSRLAVHWENAGAYGWGLDRAFQLALGLGITSIS